MDLMGTKPMMVSSKDYDHVAESLFRIQSKLNKGSNRRDMGLKKRISKLSEYNDKNSETNKQWNQSCVDQKEANLLKNCNKALLMEKKVKQKK